MPQFLIYRHGSNTANQSMRDRAPVAIVEAADAEAACATHRIDGAKLDAGLPAYLTLDDSVTIWANQRVSAVAEADADPSDWNEAGEKDEYVRAYRAGDFA